MIKRLIFFGPCILCATFKIYAFNIEALMKAKALSEKQINFEMITRADLNLSEADLTWADLSGFCLKKVNLCHANLFGAKLKKTNF